MAAGDMAVEVMEEEAAAEVTGKAPAGPSQFEPDYKVYENMRLMKTQTVKAVRIILCLAALVVTHGCTTPQNSVTGKSWSQTAAEEEQEQQLSDSPQDYWNVLP